MKTTKLDGNKVDEIIIEAEEFGRKKEMELAEKKISDEPAGAKGSRDKISSILIIILLLLSIIQSVELFDLRSKIASGQFLAGAAASSASGGEQSLPAQQGGC